MASEREPFQPDRSIESLPLYQVPVKRKGEGGHLLEFRVPQDIVFAGQVYQLKFHPERIPQDKEWLFSRLSPNRPMVIANSDLWKQFGQGKADGLVKDHPQAVLFNLTSAFDSSRELFEGFAGGDKQNEMTGKDLELAVLEALDLSEEEEWEYKFGGLSADEALEAIRENGEFLEEQVADIAARILTKEVAKRIAINNLDWDEQTLLWYRGLVEGSVTRELAVDISLRVGLSLLGTSREVVFGVLSVTKLRLGLFGIG